MRLQISHRLRVLIEKSQLFDAIADDDDIEWKTDPFEMRPESVNRETPDEIIAMITFEGSPEPLQRIHRHRLYIDPVTSRTDRTNDYRNRSAQPPSTSAPFR